MEERYILSTKTHEDWRNYLLVNSFFFQVLLRHLREQLGLPQNGLKSTQEILEWEQKTIRNVIHNNSFTKKGGNKSGTRKIKEHFANEEAIRRDLYRPILEILETFHDLNLDFQLIRLFALGETNLSFHGSTRVQIVTSPDDPIRETGVYIKYTPDLTDKELITLKKQAQAGYTTLSHIKDFKLPTLEKKSKSPSEDQLQVFIAVETYLIQNYINKPNAFVIKTIFEAVAKQLKSKEGTVRRKYYSIINNFQLPSTPEVNKIPRE